MAALVGDSKNIACEILHEDFLRELKKAGKGCMEGESKRLLDEPKAALMVPLQAPMFSRLSVFSPKLGCHMRTHPGRHLDHDAAASVLEVALRRRLCPAAERQKPFVRTHQKEVC